LIWFQHFHKAAGTTVVSLAKLNGEILYPQNRNGNPIDDHGRDLPIWTYDGELVSTFVDECQNLGCTFVCSEWGVGDLETLRSDERVRIVTSLREPLDRLVSTFIFDYRLGYTTCKDIEDYVGSKRSFSYYNYYCHMLARLNNEMKTVTAEDFARAKKTLGYFDHIGIVEQPNWLERLCCAFDWQPQDVRANRRNSGTLEAARHLLRGKVSAAKRLLDSTHLAIGPDFRTRFAAANKFDFALYSHARTLQSQMP
jgi:hypothetical protein